jgi:hypothetical protein
MESRCNSWTQGSVAVDLRAMKCIISTTLWISLRCRESRSGEDSAMTSFNDPASIVREVSVRFCKSHQRDNFDIGCTNCKVLEVLPSIKLMG